MAKVKTVDEELGRAHQFEMVEPRKADGTSDLDKHGHEIPDPTPMAPPVGFMERPSMVDIIRNMVRSEALRQAAEQSGSETFEDADDFEVGDDYDPSSPYEDQFDPVPISELRKRAEDAQTALAKAERIATESAAGASKPPEAPASSSEPE